MSTAAHEPRRVGPRRVEPPAENKVTPRRNNPGASELPANLYDSDELPVLIRLPDLRTLDSSEPTPAAPSRRKRHRIDRPSAASAKTHQADGGRASGLQRAQQVGSNKLVLVGVVAGITIVAALFLFNGSGSQSTSDEDGWAQQSGEPELLIQEPEISIPNESTPPALYPGFAYEAPDAQTTRFTSGELESAPVDLSPAEVPFADQDMPRLSPAVGTADQNSPQPITAWPADETLSPPANNSVSTNGLWPAEPASTGLDQQAYPSTQPRSSSELSSDRSSSYPDETPSYRTGMLGAEHSQSMHDQPSRSILDGNIEIPDTTSLR